MNGWKSTQMAVSIAVMAVATVALLAGKIEQSHWTTVVSTALGALGLRKALEHIGIQK